MGQRDTGEGGKPDRAQTDESLRVERAEADAVVEKKQVASEAQEDGVLRLARERADEVVQTARGTGEANSQLGQSRSDQKRADGLVEGERATADAILKSERAERKRYLADFLAREREATDKDLVVERAHADEIVAARDEFLATVSHDLRGMLGALGMNAELLIERVPNGASDDVRKHAALNKRLLGRMNTLINDLLDVASIEAGKLAFLPEHVEVATLIQETIETFGPLAAAKHIALVVDVDEPKDQIHARLDAGRILQVLANLISNALKFTPAGGRISIRVKHDASEFHVAVNDTGIGISESALPSVFDRFHQVNKSRGGLGLGLHISKSIIEAHGGKMWAESTPSVGSTFHFALPTSASPPR